MGSASAQGEATPPPVQDIAAFCAPLLPDPDRFSDIGGNTFEAAIECSAELGVTQGGPAGLPSDQYGPTLTVSRAQMASFIARLIDGANALDTGDNIAGLPDFDGTSAFTDIGVESAANPHFLNINRLQQAGVVQGGPGGRPATQYGPSDLVSRAQMASFVNRAIQHMTGAAISTTDDFFADDEGATAHEANINGITSVGITQGVDAAGDTYGPSGPVSRGQMAAFMSRTAGELEERGDVAVPRVPTTVTLEPLEADNVLDTDHVLTATVLDQIDDPVAGEQVYLDVYRDAVEDPLVEDFELVVGASGALADLTDASGEASATVTSDVAATDVYIACVDLGDVAIGVDELCTDAVDTDEDGAIVLDEITPVDEADVFGIATKDWAVAVPTLTTLEPLEAENVVGANQTVTATVVDQFGEPLTGADVTIEVYDELDPETAVLVDTVATVAGAATITYTSDVARADAIFACLDPDGTGCTILVEEEDDAGNLVLEREPDPGAGTVLEAEVEWVVDLDEDV